MNAVHEETYKGCRIEVWNDEMCESPREWSNIEKLFTWERDYGSIDDVPFSGIPDSLDLALARLREEGEIVYWKFISKYSHSSVIYRMGTPKQFPDWQWDAGYVGLAVVYKSDYESCCEPWTGTSEQIERCREAIVNGLQQYTDWCNGQTWGYATYDWNGGDLDSSGGYIGSYDGDVLEDARRSIDDHIQERQNKASMAALAGV